MGPCGGVNEYTITTTSIVTPGASGASPSLPASQQGTGIKYASPSSPATQVSANPTSAATTTFVASASTTSPSVTASTPTAFAGQPVLLTAVLPTAQGGGKVRFVANGKVIKGCGAVKVNQLIGGAVCTARFLQAGVFRIEVLYRRGSGFALSRSPVITVSVKSSLTLAAAPRTTANGVIFSVRCAQGSGGCQVTVTLSIPRPAPAGGTGGRRAQPVLVAGNTKTISAGSTATLTAKLNAHGRTLLAQQGHLSVQEVTSLTVGGQRVVVNKSTVMIP
jgi:hypothetical protein